MTIPYSVTEMGIKSQLISFFIQVTKLNKTYYVYSFYDKIFNTF